MKRVIFIVTIAILGIAICEVGAQGVYVLTRGKFVWQREEFRVGDFTQRVNDERYFTAKPDYHNTSYTGIRDGFWDDAVPWDIEMDGHGFRIGANAVFENGPNVAFIGDSVPFGYRVSSHDTVPSIFQELIHQRGYPHGVINAALPAYSLDQAVHRYKYELAGRYDIEAMVLQIYDPASQFMQLGRDWDVTKNWVTFPHRPEPFPLFRYSSLWHAMHALREAYDRRTARLDGSDEVAIRHYVTSINASLEVLREATKGKVKRVIILPTTLPPKTWALISEPHRVALTVLNNTLREFVQRHDGMEFIDTNELFASDPDGRGFIDECCHLSHEGATQVAHLLAEHIPVPSSGPQEITRPVRSLYESARVELRQTRYE